MEWANGKYAYPNAIKDVVSKVAKYKNISVENLINIISENINRLGINLKK